MKRPGTSLLEVMVGVSLSGVVLTAAATMLVALWKADRRIQADLNQRQSLARLDIALRKDAHEAQAAEVIDGRRLKLSLDTGQTVEYSAEDQRVLRLKKSGEAVVHRETYALAAGTNVSMAADKVDSRASGIVRLTIEGKVPANSGNRGIVRSAILEAALGAGRPGGQSTETTP